MFAANLYGGIGLALGWLMAGVILSQALLALYSAWRRFLQERAQVRLSRERLELQIKSARAQLKQVEAAKALWNGYRKFRVARKVSECDGVFSFYLAPHDGKPLPAYKPGQYLTFQFAFPQQAKPVVRCYSLSDSPRPDQYRVTIKREKPPHDHPDLPPGLVSSFFCDSIREGDILDVKAPAGHFCLDLEKHMPVALLSSGVGVTPMLSMATALLEGGSQREVWFFHGCRNHCEHIQKAQLEALAAAHRNFHLQICYSRPTPADVAGRDYHHPGYVTPELIQTLLPSSNYEFFVCGNGSFMKSVTEGLEAWGVPEKEIHFEAFGPASVKKKAAAPAETALATASSKITFSKSGKICNWDATQTNLLDFALAQGVRIDSGCCAGSCGSCVVAIKSGDVEYLKDPDAPLDDGCCLMCLCRPKTDLILDA